jgi:transcription elongation factor Elf1
MDDPEWLRTQLASFTCPCCGRRYRGSPVSLLAERDGLYFVDLNCLGCGSRTVAIVTIEAEDAEGAIADLAGMNGVVLDPADAAPPGSDPVTADDVLEMHQFLASYEGGLTTLMRR